MTATLLVKGCAPPSPSTLRGSGEPMIRNSRSSRSAGSAGRSEAKNNAPLEVPPRIRRQGIPSVPGMCTLAFHGGHGAWTAHGQSFPADSARKPRSGTLVKTSDTILLAIVLVLDVRAALRRGPNDGVRSDR